jgi:hypothetical protein
MMKIPAQWQAVEVAGFLAHPVWANMGAFGRTGLVSPEDRFFDSPHGMLALDSNTPSFKADNARQGSDEGLVVPVSQGPSPWFPSFSFYGPVRRYCAEEIQGCFIALHN